MPRADHAADSPARPSLASLFAGFFQVGIIGFGGVLPWLRRMVVEQRRWQKPAEFTDMLAFCQFLPGGNVINYAVTLGRSFHGARGAVVALTGLLAAPVAIALGLGALYDRFGTLPVVARALAGLAPAAAGLVLANAIKIALPLRGRALGIGVAAVTTIAIAVLRLPLLPAVLVLVPLSILLHARPER